MRKIFTVLLLTISTIFISSCIIVNPDDLNLPTNYYDLTCYNMSDTYITDWCVVRNNRVTYAISKDLTCPIRPNGNYETLENLPEGKYKLYVAFVTNPDYDAGDYVESKTINLTKDYEVYIDQTFVDEYIESLKH